MNKIPKTHGLGNITRQVHFYQKMRKRINILLMIFWIWFINR